MASTTNGDQKKGKMKFHLSKDTIKGPTQVNGHSLKLHFCIFERSQVKHNNLDYNKFFEVFFINCKFYMFKAFKLQQWTIIVFFKRLFFLPNMHHFFSKLERILTLMIRRAKGFKLRKIVSITNLNTFGLKVLLTLKIMDFENVPLIKVVHVYVIEGMNA